MALHGYVNTNLVVTGRMSQPEFIETKFINVFREGRRWFIKVTPSVLN